MNGAGSLARRLGVAAVVLLALPACTSGEPAEPEPEPTPAEDPTEEPTEPEPDPEAEALSETIVEITEQVAALRDLEVLEEVTTEIVEPDELAEIVTERDRDAEAVERLAASTRVLAALRHVPVDADLERIIDDLQSASVVGLYDAADEVAYVSGEELPLSPAAATTAAHEVVHALQDQHFDLSRLDDIPLEDGDSALAFLSVVEGDAVILEEEWAATHQDEEERREAEQEQLDGAAEQLAVLDDVPSYVVESFVFPYVAGERFVASLIEEGGYEAVDAALADPPTTTLEILDPQAYLDGVELAEVEAGTAPVDGEEVFASSFGAFDLLALFGAAEDPEAQAGSATWPSWRGGALRAWEVDETLVVAAAWRFADDESAATACDAVAAWYRDVAALEDETEADDGAVVLEAERDAVAIRCDGPDVRFALSEEPTLAEDVSAAD